MEEKEWLYDDIKKITEEEAKSMCLEEMDIKGFQCYFVDFKGRFGYSALAFKNGHCISGGLNMYQLHNPSAKSNEELQKRYIRIINKNLFTDKELCGPVIDYDDYNNKRYYIHNYLPLEYDRLTMWAINGKYTDPEEIEKSESGEYTYSSKIAFAYFKNDDFDRRAVPLLEQLELAYERLEMEPDFFRQAVRRGMDNHEAGYTGEFLEGVESVGYDFFDLDDEHKTIVLEEFVKCCDYENPKGTLEYLKEQWGVTKKCEQALDER